MAKSRETFNKKEKEKKRLKKKQEKEEKKEARKTHSGKGAGMSDMIAYVDSEGNITDTPPDPQRVEEIELDSIEISVSRRSDTEGDEDSVRIGKIAFFNTSKGYGFIRDQATQESIFFHVNGVLEQIAEGDLVTFDTEKTPKGLSAVEVKLAPKK